MPAPSEALRAPVSFRWYAEDRPKDTPELAPFPGDYTEKFRVGLQTQSGKLEFECSSLKRFDPDDPERPTITKYIPSWEGHHTEELYGKYPLQLISPHARYTLSHPGRRQGQHHQRHQGPPSAHRRLLLLDTSHQLQGCRGNGAFSQTDLVRIFNDRGSVICAAQVTERVPPGTLHAYESAATYDPVGEPGTSTDRGGCINILTPARPMIKKSHSHAGNSCLVQVERYSGEAA